MTWYTGDPTFDTVLTIGFAFAALTILGGAFSPQTPYGRFGNDKWGMTLHPKFGWWLMEIPATVVFLWFFLQGPRADELVPIILGVIWMIHYGNRGWFFPLTLRVAPGRRSTFSIVIVLSGMFVTALHGYLHASWYTEFGEHLTRDWLTDPRFIIGVLIYYSGFALTLHSESVVRNLRAPGGAAGQPDYKIPYGGGFRFVSSPAYLGELIGWAGFAIMSWGLPGVVIFLISAGNLIPRALATKTWYQQKFPDYPRERRAIIPYVL
mgnify:CR=1 FL=1